MKYLYKTGLFFLLVAFGSNIKVAAQEGKKYNWQLGFGVGYTNYYGDLSNYRINGGNELYKIYKFAGYNPYYQHQPSFSLLLQKKVTPTLGIMFQANYLQFGMSDRYRKNSGALDTASYNYARSLNFRTTMQDVGLAFTFSPNNGRIGSKTAFFYPSFYVGAGVSKFVVKGDLYDANNNPYNYRLPGVINDDTYETNLRDQLSETDTKFKDIVPYVDLGLALNFRISELLTIAFQSDIKYSASDYLDGVSATYKSFYPTAAAAYVAKPGYNVVDPVTMNRGDNNGINDFYINNRIVLNIALSRKQGPKKFNSPVIYSVSTPYYRPQKKSDSVKKQIVINKDSLMHSRQDSINNGFKDSLLLMKFKLLQSPSTSDSALKKQLESINTELKNIKNVLRDQQVKPRLQQLQYQSDSVKNLRNRFIIQRSANKENNLQIHIYDLQIDSLHNEYEKVRGQQNYPSIASDSLRMSYQSYVPVKEIPADVNDSQEKAVTTNRYDSVLRSSYLRKMDSVQHRLNELEKRSGNTDSVNAMAERRRSKFIADSTAAYKNTVDMEDQLQKERGDLAILRKQLKASNDSATYYKKMQETSRSDMTPDTLQMKTSWLQRYFGIGGKKKKTPVKTDTVYSADYNKQQQYYEEQANATNSKIAQNEKSANELAERKVNYEKQNNNQPDSATYVRNISMMQQGVKRNSDSIALLQRQLKKSADSSAYYQQQTLAASKKINDINNQKWYQDMFVSERKRQRQISDDNDTRTKSMSQQQYYDNDTRNMQKRIDDLEARNRELTNSYQSMDAERNQRRTNTTAVIPLNVYGGGNHNSNDRREIADLKAELQNLKNEVNYDTRGNYFMDTTLRQRNYVLDTILTGTNQRRLAASQSPVIVKQDTSQVNLLRNELSQLRNQVDSLRNHAVARPPAPVIAEKPSKPKFDVTSFPVVSVYFKTGSITLPGDQLNKIAPFAGAANKNKDATIILKGFTDPVGNAAKNKVIANKRSDYIKRYLVTKYKIADSRIIMEEPAQSEGTATKKANPLDRRVDLQFQ
jgi:outer membrane protein OmpA-like peptidoglycan-associated protein